MLLVFLTIALAIVFAWFVIWRSGYVRGWRASRVTPPTCIECGYNLSGLTQCRCPECGAEHKIDELWRHAIVNGKGKKKREA